MSLLLCIVLFCNHVWESKSVKMILWYVIDTCEKTPLVRSVISRMKGLCEILNNGFTMLCPMFISRSLWAVPKGLSALQYRGLSFTCICDVSQDRYDWISLTMYICCLWFPSCVSVPLPSLPTYIMNTYITIDIMMIIAWLSLELPKIIFPSYSVTFSVTITSFLYKFFPAGALHSSVILFLGMRMCLSHRKTSKWAPPLCAKFTPSWPLTCEWQCYKWKWPKLPFPKNLFQNKGLAIERNATPKRNQCKQLPKVPVEYCSFNSGHM